MRMYKSKYEKIVYKFIIVRSIDVNTVDSKIWDILRVTKFKTKSKSMLLLIIKQDQNYIKWAICKWKIMSSKLLTWSYISLNGGKVTRGIIKWRKKCQDKRKGRIEIIWTLTNDARYCISCLI